MQPAVFVSHGAPTLPLEPSPARDFLTRLGQDLARRHGRPDAILCVSAHWETARPAASVAVRPETIHDFYGFPEALYRMSYPAPGAPAAAKRAAELIEAAGAPCALDPGQGLDHGAWVPLKLMWPAANIPVAQLAIQHALGPAHHFTLGRAIAGLRAENILILASGSATHNLRDVMARRQMGLEAPPDWALAFTDWLDRTVETGDAAALVNYRQQAPGAVQAHPRDEHFLPIMVAMGSGGDDARGQRLHASFTAGSLAMSAYGFGTA